MLPQISSRGKLHISLERYTKIIREARIFIDIKKFPALKLSAFYPSLEPKERQALARLLIKEVKIFNGKVDVEFLEFPELAHQDPIQILKGLSIRGAIFYAHLRFFKISLWLVRHFLYCGLVSEISYPERESFRGKPGSEQRYSE